LKNKSIFHAPLHSHDTENQTFGCRHTNPDICSKNSLPQLCAFVRKDNICLSPSKAWPKQYKKLKEAEEQIQD